MTRLLLIEIDAMHTRKSELKAHIKSFISEFIEKNGREPAGKEKNAMKGPYGEYKQVCAKLDASSIKRKELEAEIVALGKKLKSAK